MNKKIFIIVTVVIIIIIIVAVLSFVLLSKSLEPQFEIIDVDLERQNGGFKFTHNFKYNNFPDTNVDLKWVIKLIGNDTVYGTHEMNMTITTHRSDGASGIYYFDFESQAISGDKYRVEVYWDDKLMDSIEKDIIF